MYNQNIRINAAITYCFFGPVFLLARKGTPLSHPFVQSHARKATFFLAITIILLGLLYSFRHAFSINIFGFSLLNILTSIVVIFCIGLHLIWWYRAFKGLESSTFFSKEKLLQEFSLQENEHSNEEKIRIFMSFLPFFGIFLSSKYPLSEILTARKVSNFFVFLLIVASFFDWNFWLFHFLILTAYLVLIVSTGVFLTYKSKLLSFKWYDFIPTYQQCEAYILTSISMFFEYIRIAFGKNQTQNFHDLYKKNLENFSRKIPFQTDFWMHPAIISLPIINLITLPSFFQKKYHEYQGNISEWFFLTILTFIIIFFGNWLYFYFLLFPIITLFAFAKQNSHIRAPITSISRNIFIFFYKTKKQITELKNNEITESIEVHADEKNSQNSQ